MNPRARSWIAPAPREPNGRPGGLSAHSRTYVSAQPPATLLKMYVANRHLNRRGSSRTAPTFL